VAGKKKKNWPKYGTEALSDQRWREDTRKEKRIASGGWGFQKSERVKTGMSLEQASPGIVSQKAGWGDALLCLLGAARKEDMGSPIVRNREVEIQKFKISQFLQEPLLCCTGLTFRGEQC